jgi:anti-sigma factor RsiW
MRRGYTVNCRETLTMLNGYMDGELDLVQQLEIERHVQSCPECAHFVHNGRAIQTVVQSERLYYAAPRRLESRVLAAVRAAERAEQPRRRSFLRPAIGIAAFASLLVLCWFVFARVSHANREAVVTEQVMGSHVHSLMANHLLDIASDNAYLVKPWFNGRLDYAPPVVDLNHQGYPLLGARLDYLIDRSVSALVYTRQKHLINLFVWPTVEPDTPTMRQESRHGYQLCRWTLGGMTYCAVSDLSAQELALFADAIKAHTTPIEYENCK